MTRYSKSFPKDSLLGPAHSPRNQASSVGGPPARSRPLAGFCELGTARKRSQTVPPLIPQSWVQCGETCRQNAKKSPRLADRGLESDRARPRYRSRSARNKPRDFPSSRCGASLRSRPSAHQTRVGSPLCRLRRYSSNPGDCQVSKRSASQNGYGRSRRTGFFAVYWNREGLGNLGPSVLTVLWWDPKHQVCPSLLKHT